MDIFEELFGQYNNILFGDSQMVLYQTSKNTWNTCPQGIKKGCIPDSFIQQKIFNVDKPIIRWNGKHYLKIQPNLFNIKYSKNRCVSTLT